MTIFTVRPTTNTEDERELVFSEKNQRGERFLEIQCHIMGHYKASLLAMLI